jgi:MFS family permease
MDSARSLRASYAFAFFSMFLVIIPVIVPWFTSLGLSMKEILELQAVFGLAVALLEVPTGYLGDLWGRRNSMRLGSLALGAGFTWAVFARDYADLLIFELTLALGFSLISGSDVALIYDQAQAGAEGDGERRARGTRALANLQLSQVAGESIAALLAGPLVALSFRHALVAQAVAGWIPLLVTLRLRDSGERPRPRGGHLENFRRVLHEVFGRDRLLRLSFVNLVVWGTSTFLAVWLLQKRWDEIGVPLAWFGVIWSVYNLAAGMAGKQVHRLERRFGAAPLLAFIGLGPVIGYALLAWATDQAAVLAIGMIFYFCRGTGQVLLRDALNWRIGAELRATVNSLHSLAFRLSFAALGPVVGWIIDRHGMPPAFATISIAFVAAFAIVLLPLLRELRRQAPGGGIPVPTGVS